MCRTVPVTPNLSRLKSMMRYCRLWPPPRRRMAMWPWLSRPPDFLIGSSSDFSGSVVVMSEKSDTERKRVPFVTGLNCLIGIACHPERGCHPERSEGPTVHCPVAGSGEDEPLG